MLTPSNSAGLKDYLKLLRPHQWVKNLLIVLPAFFAGVMNIEAISNLMPGLIAFCLLSSGVYVFNDLYDIDQDKHHPIKKNRPLASERVKKSTAWMIFFSLLTVTGLTLWLAQVVVWPYATYFLVNILYSTWLKHIAIVDILTPSIGYVLRLFAGALISEVWLSHWMIIMIFLAAIFILLGKRRETVTFDEVVTHRKAYEHYAADFIHDAQVMIASVIVICYIMYCISPDIISQSPYLPTYVTALPVLLGFLRYFQVVRAGDHPHDAVYWVRDPHISTYLVFWAALFVFILYLNG